MLFERNPLWGAVSIVIFAISVSEISQVKNIWKFEYVKLGVDEVTGVCLFVYY